VTRKSLLLFTATSVIWGSSFLFIRLAVEQMPPAWVVFGRTLLGAAFLAPLAAKRHAFRGVRQVLMPAVAGLVLIALGAWLATSRRTKSQRPGYRERRVREFRHPAVCRANTRVEDTSYRTTN
jgi:drug/metabolite transporter (DMT)-like permease